MIKKRFIQRYSRPLIAIFCLIIFLCGLNIIGGGIESSSKNGQMDINLADSDWRFEKNLTSSDWKIDMVRTGDVDGDLDDDLLVQFRPKSKEEQYVGGIAIIYGTMLLDSEKSFDINNEKFQEELLVIYSKEEKLELQACADFNGDGVDDIAFGSETADNLNNEKTNCGEVFILFGSDSISSIGSVFIEELKNSFPGLWIIGERELDYLTITEWNCDLNGDGYDDIILAACSDNDVGEIIIILGRSDFITKTKIDLASNREEFVNITIIGEKENDLFRSVGICDVNGDGKDELLIPQTNPNIIIDGKNYAADNNILSIVFFEDLITKGLEYKLHFPNSTLTGINITNSYTISGSITSYGDINDDMYDDLLFFVLGSFKTFIYFGNGDAELKKDSLINLTGMEFIVNSKEWWESSSVKKMISFADIDNDNKDDLLLGHFGYWVENIIFCLYGSKIDTTSLELHPSKEYDIKFLRNEEPYFYQDELDYKNDGHNDLLFIFFYNFEGETTYGITILNTTKLFQEKPPETDDDDDIDNDDDDDTDKEIFDWRIFLMILILFIFTIILVLILKRRRNNNK